MHCRRAAASLQGLYISDAMQYPDGMLLCSCWWYAAMCMAPHKSKQVSYPTPLISKPEKAVLLLG